MQVSELPSFKSFHVLQCDDQQRSCAKLPTRDAIRNLNCNNFDTAADVFTGGNMTGASKTA